MYIFPATLIMCTGYAALGLQIGYFVSYKMISCRKKYVEVGVFNFQITR